MAYGFMWAITFVLQVLRNHFGWDPPPSNIHVLSYIYNTCIYIYIYINLHTHIYIYIHNGHVAKSDIDASKELIGNFGDIFLRSSSNSPVNDHPDRPILRLQEGMDMDGWMGWDGMDGWTNLWIASFKHDGCCSGAELLGF